MYLYHLHTTTFRPFYVVVVVVLFFFASHPDAIFLYGLGLLPKTTYMNRTRPLRLLIKMAATSCRSLCQLQILQLYYTLLYLFKLPSVTRTSLWCEM